MYPYRNLLESLTAQTKKGDTAAALQLHRELRPNLVMMVRQTMRPGGAKTPMDGRIRSEARRLGLRRADDRSAQRELLIEEVAESVCRNYIAELRSPSRQSIPAAGTVCCGAAPSMALMR
jgi:hypothetical protein